jgi:hypothetical protein
MTYSKCSSNHENLSSFWKYRISFMHTHAFHIALLYGFCGVFPSWISHGFIVLFQQRIHALTNITTQVVSCSCVGYCAPIMQLMGSCQAITINLPKHRGSFHIWWASWSYSWVSRSCEWSWTLNKGYLFSWSSSITNGPKTLLTSGCAGKTLKLVVLLDLGSVKWYLDPNQF